ncbi:hypothetical protein QHH_59 [Halomonas phage QHHSV-1]|nr:hypothetical protein QHH_59 [Halomonas phage QHHSV-1]
MDDQAKGGTLARQAAMLCQDPAFGLYLDARLRWETSMSPTQIPDGTASDLDAAEFIRQRCGVSSRAELDHNEWAAAMYKRIVNDYSRWKRRAGL